jgi:hypothetical protein
MRKSRRLAVYMALTGLLAAAAVCASAGIARADLTAKCITLITVTAPPACTLNGGIAAPTAPASLTASVTAYSAGGFVSVVAADVTWTVTCTDSTGTAETAGGFAGMTPLTGELALPATADGQCEVSVTGALDTTDTVYYFVVALDYTQIPPPAVTTTTLTSSADPSVAGQQVTYTATVSPAPSGGTVSFTDNVSPIGGCGTQPVDPSTGTATCATTPGTAGAHNIVAAYTGTTGFAASTSPVLTQVVTSTPCSSLAGCNLRGLNLTGAQLAGADLSGANLNGADLSGADLSGANLSGANLNKANLTGANLSGANVTGANFNKVIWSNTTCPDGTSSDADGGTCTSNL